MNGGGPLVCPGCNYASDVHGCAQGDDPALWTCRGQPAYQTGGEIINIKAALERVAKAPTPIIIMCECQREGCPDCFPAVAGR